jgi:hypothetical protein
VLSAEARLQRLMAAMQERVRFSVPVTPEGWREDAEAILRALDGKDDRSSG